MGDDSEHPGTLAYVRGVIRVPARTEAQAGGKRHGDAAVAYALAYAASRAEFEDYAYRPVPRAGDAPIAEFEIGAADLTQAVRGHFLRRERVL